MIVEKFFMVGRKPRKEKHRKMPGCSDLQPSTGPHRLTFHICIPNNANIFGLHQAWEAFVSPELYPSTEMPSQIHSKEHIINSMDPVTLADTECHSTGSQNGLR